MPNRLKLVIILTVIFLFLIILNLIKKKKIPVKYSIVWFLSGSVILIVALFTNVMSDISKLIGFEVLSNMLIFTLIGLLIVITLYLTTVSSKQQNQIKNLIQELSILEREIRKK